MKNLTSLKWIFLSSLIFSPIFGCTPPDMDGRLKEFTDMTSELRTTAPVGTIQDGEKVNFSGTYLLRLQSLLSNDLNQSLYFKIEATVSDSVDNVDLKVTGVDHNTLKPVGDSYDLPNNPISEDGTFTFKLENLDFPGPVNSITGNPIQVNVVLTASIKSETTFCGTITEGKLLKPIPYDLPGSTFFAKVVDFNETINKDDIPNKCPGSSTEQPDDGGTDETPDETPSEPGETPKWGQPTENSFYHCVEGLDLTGDWTLEFKTNDFKDSANRLEFNVNFTKATSDVKKTCYVGTIKTEAGKEVGTISSMSVIDGFLVLQISDLKLAAKQYPNLKTDGKIAILGLVNARTDEALCGKMVADVKKPDDSIFKEKSAGTWSLHKKDTTGPKLGSDKTLSGCNAFTDNAPNCDAFAGFGSEDGNKYDIQVKSILGTTKFKSVLYSNKLTCVNGEFLKFNKEGEEVLYAIIPQAGIENSKVIFNVDSIFIPKNLKYRDGAWAKQKFTVENNHVTESNPNFCGKLKVNIFHPDQYKSDSTFKMMKEWEGGDFDGTCN